MISVCVAFEMVVSGDITRRFRHCGGLINCLMAMSDKGANSAGSGVPISAAVRAFRASIPLDVCAYPLLDRDLPYAPWVSAVRALARLHDVHEVLDHRYIPCDAESDALFEEKQKFMFAVFVRTTLHTSEGQSAYSLTREGDAQSFYEKLWYRRLLSHMIDNDVGYECTCDGVRKFRVCHECFLAQAIPAQTRNYTG